MKSKVIWLGQAGLMFEINGKKIFVDPYLSDYVGSINPDKHRRMPVDDTYLNMKPDVIILTHDHIDHTDPQTLKHYLDENSNITVLASYNAWQKAREFGGSNNNYVSFNQNTVWTQDGITYTAVRAEHSDLYSIGVIIDDGNRKYYVTGDTLYNKDIFKALPNDIYAVFLPVNGVGNNMNRHDAMEFAKKTGAKKVVPLHFGLFDDIIPVEFDIIPEIYKKINL